MGGSLKYILHLFKGKFYNNFNISKMAPKYAMAIGRVRDKGFRVTKHKAPVKPSRRKGVQHKHVKFVRDLVRDIAGFAPYEKRCLELLKVSKDKRSQKAFGSEQMRKAKATRNAERSSG